MPFLLGFRLILACLLVAAPLWAGEFSNPDPFANDPLAVLGIDREYPTPEQIAKAYRKASQNIYYRENPHAQRMFRAAKETLERQFPPRTKPVKVLLTFRESIEHAKSPADLVSVWGNLNAETATSDKPKLIELLWQRLKATFVQLNNENALHSFVSAMKKNNLLFRPDQWRELKADLNPTISNRIDLLQNLIPAAAESSLHARVLYFQAFANAKPPYGADFGIQGKTFDRFFEAAAGTDSTAPNPSSADLSARLGLTPWACLAEVERKYTALMKDPQFSESMALREAWEVLRGPLRAQYESEFYFSGYNPGGGPLRTGRRFRGSYRYAAAQSMLDSLETPTELLRALEHFPLLNVEATALTLEEIGKLRSLARAQLAKTGATLSDPSQAGALLQAYSKLGAAPADEHFDRLMAANGNPDAKALVAWLGKEFRSGRLSSDLDLQWLKLLTLTHAAGEGKDGQAWNRIKYQDELGVRFIRKFVADPSTIPVALLEAELQQVSMEQNRWEEVALLPQESRVRSRIRRGKEFGLGLLGLASSLYFASSYPEFGAIKFAAGLGLTTVLTKILNRYNDWRSDRESWDRLNVKQSNQQTARVLESLTNLSGFLGRSFEAKLSTPLPKCTELYLQMGAVRAGLKERL